MNSCQLFKISLIALTLAINPVPVISAEAGTIQADLKNDLVKDSGGYFIHDQVVSCRYTKEGGGKSDSYYVKRLIKAPKILISRDNFVSISTRFLFTNRVVLASIMRPGTNLLDALNSIQCAAVDAQTIQFDFEININMSTDGLEVVTIDRKAEQTATDNLTWEQVLGLDTE